MKKVYALQLTLLLALAGCKYDSTGNQATLPNTMIGLSDTKYNLTPETSFSIDSVLNDSRCPVDVECFWAGNAAVRINFFINGNINRILLNTTLAPKETSIDGFKIKLVGLLPAPHNGVVIKQSDYLVSLLITKE